MKSLGTGRYALTIGAVSALRQAAADRSRRSARQARCRLWLRRAPQRHISLGRKVGWGPAFRISWCSLHGRPVCADLSFAAIYFRLQNPGARGCVPTPPATCG